MSDDWVFDVEEGWKLLSFEDRVQWFATKDITRLSPEGVATLVGKKVMGGQIDSLKSLLETVRNAEALGWNLYLNANPVSPKLNSTKVSRGDVTHWRYVTIDLDPTENALAPPSDIPAAHRIFSGRGYQFWLPISGTPCLSDEATRASIERGMQGYLRHLGDSVNTWAPGWKVDTACSDLARVVRCPGSVNQKTGRRSTVEKFATAPAVQTEEILQHAVPVPVKHEMKTPPGGWNLLTLLPYLNQTTTKFLLGGVEQGDRHRSCYATAKSLHELDVPLSTANAMLRMGASYCTPPLPEHDVQRTVERVYNR